MLWKNASLMLNNQGFVMEEMQKEEKESAAYPILHGERDGEALKTEKDIFKQRLHANWNGRTMSGFLSEKYELLQSVRSGNCSKVFANVYRLRAVQQEVLQIFKVIWCIYTDMSQCFVK